MVKWAGLVFVLGLIFVFGGLYSQSSTSISHVVQPIAFSHALHAGELQIACGFCHRHASESMTVSVPTVYRCMSCHRALKKTTPEMEKLLAYWKRQEPVPWVRPERLPDFVYFTHQMHLRAGLDCTECHGQVVKMTEAPAASTYKMGWCLGCHRQRGASQDCWTCHK